MHTSECLNGQISFASLVVSVKTKVRFMMREQEAN